MEGRVPRTEYDRATDPNASRSLRVVPVPSPAAGAEWSIAVPSAVWWDVVAITYTFAVANTGSARTSSIVYTIYGTGFQVATTSAAQGINTTRPYSWVAGSPENQVAPPAFQESLPREFGPLPPGSTIGTSTSTIAAGDQYTAISLLVREVLMVGLPGTPTATG